MTTLHLLVPEGYDDPHSPSGGNRYDRQVRDGLRDLGWEVVIHPVNGRWPDPDAAALASLRESLAAVPSASLVAVDGLVGSLASDVVCTESDRLHIVVLAHMPFGVAANTPALLAAEAATLRCVAAVVTPSNWTRDQLISQYRLAPERVHVARPGVVPAPPAPGTASGRELLCVGAVTEVKGHDILASALAALAEFDWRCTFVGPLDREPGFVRSLRATLDQARVADKVRFTGPFEGEALDRAFEAADVLVQPSRFESYGMVVAEASAHGLPVIATEVGGLPEAMGTTLQGRTPGILVPAGDAEALRAAISVWLHDPDLRGALRGAAVECGARRGGWEATVRGVARILERVSAIETK